MRLDKTKDTLYHTIYIYTYLSIYIYIESLRAYRWAKLSWFCGYVFLRNVVAKVLIWHLPEHELKLSGGLWGV